MHILVLVLLIAPLGLAAGCGVKEKPHAASLVGTEWIVTSLMGEEPIAGSEITLRFEKAYLTGHMGCNRYGGGPDSGRYAAAGDGRLIVRPLAVTVQLCSEPEGIMEQEAAYIGALQRAAAYRITDSRFQIADASGETVLVFVRAQ
jgi:heat shock protein HslJ